MNTQYRKNLKDVATACKNYTDKRFEDFKWELGTHTIDTETDSDVAYQKQAPNGTIGCQINSVGGMSYKSENLIVLSDVAETTTNGITYKVENGVITFSGVASANFNITLTINLSLSSGSYTHCQVQTFPSGLSSNLGISGSAIDGNNQSLNYSRTFSVESDTTSTTMYFVFVSGANVNGLTLRPMVVRGSTAPTTYQPYFTGIRDSAVTSVVAEGENLLNVPNVSETTTNGITYKIQNGVITLSGTANASINISFNVTENSLDTSFVLSLFNAVPNNDIVFILNFIDENGFSLRTSNANAYRTFNRANSTLKSFNISIANGASISGTLQIKPMITNGSTIPTTFVNYIAPITKTIPASIQALEGYGWGINDTCYNYIDFDRKVFVQKVGRVDLGDLTYTYNGTYFYLVFSGAKLPSNRDTKANILCSMYENCDWNNLTNDMSISLRSGDSILAIINQTYTNNNTFKTAMSGVYLYYELATPVETDISSYITDNDKFLEVEQLGTITFTNTYEQEVPSEITYLTEVAK